MYNKIASIILNSGKNHNYAGEVFVSQPDSNKERLAGKIFVLAEMDGKKNETQKIINFLVNIFDYNYYGDEKILLRDKIEGLKIENIFETVLAKVNQGFAEFLQEEHLKISPSNTNLTLGVIYENKIYFSNYGKNKAFLIFRRKGDYDILNIESNIIEDSEAADSEISTVYNIAGSKIFSAVINGEIPAHSYFLFTNEALPEYVSNRELINIITKLPPMVAAEQIKNFLQKINSFAPFLGIIVKSTLGSGLNDLREESETSSQVAGAAPIRGVSNRNAHSSISHLNYTEQKTESMLAPAGIINIKKITKSVSSFLNKFKVEIPENKKIVKFYDDNDETIITQAPAKEDRQLNPLSRESFIIKDKMIFGKKSYLFLPKIWNFLKTFGIILTPSFWVGSYQGTIKWVKSLGKKDKILVGSLSLCFLILVTSLIFTASGKNARLATEQFNQVTSNINNKQADVDLYLAVGNETDAAGTLNELINSLQSTLPQNEDQETQKANLLIKLSEQNDKIQKVVNVSNFQDIINTNTFNPQAGADNLVFLGDSLYISDGLNKSIYNFNLKDLSSKQIALTESTPLTSPAISNLDIYYLAGQKIIKVSGQNVSTLNIGGDKLQGDNFIQFYAGTIYLLSKNNNQIYKYNTGLTSRSNWLKESANLTKATDFKIDGKITISQNNDDLLKFNKGQKVDYKSSLISPAISADKIIMTATNVYLLDLQNSRLINFTKEGVLVKQYRLTKDDIKDFAIDEVGKSAYILADNIVYKFSL